MKKSIGIKFKLKDSNQLEQIKSIAPDYELIVSSNDDSKFSDCEVIFGNPAPEVLLGAKNLKWLHTNTAGVNTYTTSPDFSFPNHLMLTNSSGAYGLGISEYLLTLTLALLKNLNGYMGNQSTKTWQSLGKLKTLHGSKVTVVGMGDIGANYAQKVQLLGGIVTGVTRTSKNPQDHPYASSLLTFADLDTVISEADIVALSLPETPETIHLFDETRMSRMKKGSLLLNVGRGSAICETALIQHLASGHLGGAGLDVTEIEPLPTDSPLWHQKNVILTPHISGGNSLDITLDFIFDLFIKNLRAYVNGQPFERTVNIHAGY